MGNNVRTPAIAALVSVIIMISIEDGFAFAAKEEEKHTLRKLRHSPLTMAFVD